MKYRKEEWPLYPIHYSSGRRPCIYVYMPYYLFIYLSIYLSIDLSIYLSIYLSLSVPTYIYNIYIHLLRSLSTSIKNGPQSFTSLYLPGNVQQDGGPQGCGRQEVDCIRPRIKGHCPQVFIGLINCCKCTQ